MGLLGLHYSRDCHIGCAFVEQIFWQKEDSHKSRLCFCDRCRFVVLNDVVNCQRNTRRAIFSR